MVQGQKEVVYSATTDLANVRQLALSAYRTSGQALRLGFLFAERDIKSLYRKSLLGWVWPFVPILMNTGLFIFLNRTRLINPGELDIPYPLYVFLGSLFFQLFHSCVTTPLTVFSASRDTLSKIFFPREALIVSAGLQITFDFLVKIVVATPVIIWFVGIPPIESLLVPFVIFATMMFGGAISILLVPISLIYKDVQLGLQTLLSVLIFLVPVAFNPAPESFLETIVSLNPVTPLVTVGRQLLTTGAMDGFGQIVLIGLSGILLLVAGLIAFMVTMPIVIERESA